MKTPNPISKGEENPHIKHGDWIFIDRGKNKGMLRCACGEVITKPSKTYFDLSDKEKEIVVKRAADKGSAEQVRKYGVPQGTAEWSDEFDELFVCDDGTMNKYDGNDIKSFIRRLLSSQRKQILEKVEKMRYKHNGIRCPLCTAIDEVLKIIKS